MEIPSSGRRVEYNIQNQKSFHCPDLCSITNSGSEGALIVTHSSEGTVPMT
jgi:hypothetical protein